MVRAARFGGQLLLQPNCLTVHLTKCLETGVGFLVEKGFCAYSVPMARRNSVSFIRNSKSHVG